MDAHESESNDLSLIEPIHMFPNDTVAEAWFI